MKRINNHRRKQNFITLDQLISQAVTARLTGKEPNINRILATVQHKHKVVYHKMSAWLLAAARDSSSDKTWEYGTQSHCTLQLHTDEQRLAIDNLINAHERTLEGKILRNREWEHLRIQCRRTNCRELYYPTLVNLSRYKHAPDMSVQMGKLIELLKDEKAQHGRIAD